MYPGSTSDVDVPMTLVNESLRSVKGTCVRSEQPAPGWWQASDGNWYAPELRPPIRDEPVIAQQASAPMGLPTFGQDMAFSSRPNPYVGVRPATTTDRPPAVGGLPGLPSNNVKSRRSGSKSKSILLVLIIIIVVVAVLAVGKVVLHKSSPVVVSTPATSTAQDFATQVNLRGAFVYLEGQYRLNQLTFSGITPAVMGQDPHDQLIWVSGSSNSGNGNTMSLAANGQSVTVASLSASGACWFGQINRQPGASLISDAPQYVGQLGGQCNALAAPSSGWASTFPPQA